ncbi:MAG: neutral/alkaline non-lysosomal ceramidase N-terminal domain-containing protein [Lentisphaeria bacterium]|nr:neutral/alkaline non-lysosomal ceramidase N-terminal domain-containing protein [Lentisphaeria bacterium]MDP7742584.1 neutral/alkaline non-lysosomal ceramidase N-terminal domain-containing protein [Lentisphaeria bacterium]
MKAGTASADITPPLGVVPQGHGTAIPSHSVLAPLEVRCIVFEDSGGAAAIITLDVIGTTLELTQRIRRLIHDACGITADAILVASSHTHCGPPMLPLAGLGPDSDYLQRIVDAAVDCAVVAQQNLQPVTMGLGAGSAHFNINRRPISGKYTGDALGALEANFGGIVDRRARVLRIDNEAGEPVAVLFHFSCHPTTLGGTEGFISPDYPGLARSGIEQALGCRALFLSGCSGNIRPRILDEKGEFAPATESQLRAVADELASTVVATARALRTEAAAGIHHRVADIAVPFAAPLAPAELEAYIADESDTAMARLTRHWAIGVQAAVEADKVPTAESSQMQMLKIGPLTMVTIPGEPVQEIGHAIEAEWDGTAGCEELWPCGYCNDLIGYLTTARHHVEGGYEPNAYRHSNRLLPFKDEEDAVLDGVRRLLENRVPAA